MQPAPTSEQAAESRRKLSPMQTNFLTRRRTVPGGEICEPTLLAIVAAASGLAILLAACVLAIAALPAFGFLPWTFAAVTAALVCLVRGRRRVPPGPSPPTGRRRWLGRILGGARRLFVAVLACWLGLIAWSVACPAGPDPPPKADPAHVRVITWNVHCGQDGGPPWQRFDWPARKQALRAALDRARPDILCVQEATPAQVAFLEEALPGHGRVGIGRDGAAGGEHCAVFFDRRRFENLGGDTSWLEEPTDQPRAGSAFDVKRICTWVRLRDRAAGRTLRVYNTHLYLTEAQRLPAARLILDRVAAGDRADAVLLTADFNAAPSAASRRLFADAGLADSAVRAGKAEGEPTLHLYGLGPRRL